MQVPKCLKNCKMWNDLLNRCVKCDNCESDECNVCANRCEESVYLGELMCPEFELEDARLDALEV